MNTDKLCKINKIEKQSLVDMFNIDKIEDKSSSTYRIMKEVRDKKFIELDDRIDELMIEHNKLLQ